MTSGRLSSPLMSNCVRPRRSTIASAAWCIAGSAPARSGESCKNGAPVSRDIADLLSTHRDLFGVAPMRGSAPDAVRSVNSDRFNQECKIVADRSLAQKIVPLSSGRTTRTPDRSNFRSLSQAALTLAQSQLMERTMPCPRITQQSLRKPLDAGCFEGDSTRAGPKPPVQLYDRDHLRSHLQKLRQEIL
jgi:hypothetical protein